MKSDIYNPLVLNSSKPFYKCHSNARNGGDNACEIIWIHSCCIVVFIYHYLPCSSEFETEQNLPKCWKVIRGYFSKRRKLFCSHFGLIWTLHLSDYEFMVQFTKNSASCKLSLTHKLFKYYHQILYILIQWTHKYWHTNFHLTNLRCQ